MKNKIIALSVLLSILSGGCVNMQQSKDLLTIDVTKDYPQKEFALQDIFDIDYIPLDTSRTFTTMGYMQDISKDMIIVRNLKLSSDGDIFIFDRKGKGIRKINRQGSGSEEYSFLLRVTLDEEHEELFVVDNRSKKVYIYDLQGNFKRSFKNIEGASYDRVFNLGSDYLICNDGYNLFTDEIKNIFYIISKQDGRLIKEIHIPYDKKKTSLIINKEQTKSARPRNEEFVPFHDSWILMDHSSDTIYRVFTDKRVVPFIARTPSIQSMGTEIFLYPSVLTDRYYFMQTVKKVYDFSSRVGLPRTDLMYDMKENIIYEYSLYNADYVHKEFVSLGYGGIAFINKEIAFVKTLEAPDLVDAYKNGNLKGKLKEIAASLDEESNPVLMIAKYKQKK